jgi:O-antigen ligase
VPLIDRFLPAPPAYPPPATASGIRDCVDHAALRDPYGDAVHTALGCAYLAAIGLSTALEGLLFALLVGYSVLRAPSLRRAWAPILAAPAAWLLLAWCALVLVAGAWTPDHEAWLEQLRDARVVLVLPALYPIRRRWRALVGAFLVGMSLQSAVQILQALDLAPIPEGKNAARPAGLHSHPVHVSICHAVAVCAALGWTVETRSRRAQALLAGATLLFLAGIGIAAGRAAMLGLMVALPALIALLALGGHVARRTIVVGTAVALVVAATAATVVLATGADGLRRQASDLSVSAADDATTSTGQRALWWQASLRAFLRDPILGAGPGAARTFIGDDAAVQAAIARHPERPPEFFVPAHPHSMYLQTLAETGLLGATILAALLAVALRGAWRGASERPIRCGLAAALVVWTVAAGFDALHRSGRMAALGCALLTLVALPRRHPDEPIALAREL